MFIRPKIVKKYVKEFEFVNWFPEIAQRGNCQQQWRRNSQILSRMLPSPGAKIEAEILRR